MSVTILTGPVGAGQHAIARAFAKQQERCAVIDVELIRWLVVQPHPTTWEGEEREHLHRLGATNACLLASRFAGQGIEVMILDTLSRETAPLYRQELARVDHHIVLLLPPLDELLQRRAATRPQGVTTEGIVASYREQRRLDDYDLHIDSAGLAPDVIASKLITTFKADS